MEPPGDPTEAPGRPTEEEVNYLIPERDVAKYKAEFGLSTADKGTVAQNVMAVGHGENYKTEYEAAVGHGDGESHYKIEYKETIGLGVPMWMEDDEDDNGEAEADLGEVKAKQKTPKQKAREGQVRCKINPSTKRKLMHMGHQLCQVLLTCAMTVGSFAEEVFVEPVHDLYVCLGGKHPASSEPRCLELFAGEAEISSTFARKQLGVLRPRDIRYGDDLRDPAVRQEVYREIREQAPDLVWIAPPCTRWCAFSRLNYTKQERRRLRQKKKVFLDLIDDIFLLQRLNGKHVVVENPITSDIWQTKILKRWSEDAHNVCFNLDMCSFGLHSIVDPEMRLKKGMRLMTTHAAFRDFLCKRCDLQHEHLRVQGKDTSHSGAYPRAFAEQVVKAVEETRTQSVLVASGSEQTALVPVPEAEVRAEGEDEDDAGRGEGEISFKGTVSGKVTGALRRMHQNLGHPSNRDMVRHLTLGGASKEMIAAAQNLRCSTCARCARPQAHRVAKPTALLDFNEAVAMDILYLDTQESKGHLALNMVDMASNYQVVVPLESRHATVVSETFYKFWVSWAGVPSKLVLDLDTSFRDSFWELTSGDGIAMRCAAGQAHWQNGIAERYGSSWKTTWDRLCIQHNVVDANYGMRPLPSTKPGTP